MSRIFSIVLALLVVVPIGSAQPLADRVPADALFYMGWSGSENLGSTYDQSRFKAVLDASDIRKLFTEMMPALAERAGREDAKAREVITFVSVVGERAWRHPTAVYIGSFDFADPRNHKPRVAILCDAGKESGELKQQIQTAIDRAGKMDVPISVTTLQNLVVVAVGENMPVVEADKSLSADAGFQSALGQVHKTPVAAAYLNSAGIVKMIDTAPAPRRRQQQNQQNW